MKARSLARQMALMLLFQHGDSTDPLLRQDMAELLRKTVQTLVSVAHEQIETVAQTVQTLQETLFETELGHPDNTHIPTENPMLPVPLPDTDTFRTQLNTLMAGLENLQEALYMPVASQLSEREDVVNYCWTLVRTVQTHQTEIDEKINAAAIDWRVDRIQKMDLMLLRMAAGELLYQSHVDAATVVEETLVLAERFTSPESRKFIHGILGHIAKPTENPVTENV